MVEDLEDEALEITKEAFEDYFRGNLRRIEMAQRKLEDNMETILGQYRDYQRDRMSNVIHHYTTSKGEVYYEKTKRPEMGFIQNNLYTMEEKNNGRKNNK